MINTTPVSSSPLSKEFAIDIDPVPAPRMTQRDKFAPSERVERYYDYRNELLELVGEHPVPDELHCVFHIAMPESWSHKQRKAFLGKGQRTCGKGDVDNLFKAVADALFKQDSGIWIASQKKLWSEKGRVEIKMVWSQAS